MGEDVQILKQSHFGGSPYHGGMTEHRGVKADCPDPDCGPEMSVPADWGAWCRHGAHVVVRDPDGDDEWGYPTGMAADPWPCSLCTPDEFARDMAAHEDEYTEGLIDAMRIPYQ